MHSITGNTGEHPYAPIRNQRDSLPRNLKTNYRQEGSKEFYQTNLSQNELNALLKEDARNAQEFHARQGVTTERATSFTPVAEHSNDGKNDALFQEQKNLLSVSRSKRTESQSLAEQSRAKLVQAIEDLDKVRENLPFAQKDFEEASANFNTKIKQAKINLETYRASRLRTESSNTEQDDIFLPDAEEEQKNNNLMLIKIQAEQQLKPLLHTIKQIEEEISEAQEKVEALKMTFNAIKEQAQQDLKQELDCARDIIAIISKPEKQLLSYWQHLQEEAKTSIKIANSSQRYDEPIISQRPNQVSRGFLPDEGTYLLHERLKF